MVVLYCETSVGRNLAPRGRALRAFSVSRIVRASHLDMSCSNSVCSLDLQEHGHQRVLFFTSIARYVPVPI